MNEKFFMWILNAAYGLTFALFGVIGGLFYDDLSDVQEAVGEIPLEYIRKDDYRNDQNKILESLKDISKKLDHNAEALEADYNRRLDKLEKILTELRKK